MIHDWKSCSDDVTSAYAAQIYDQAGRIIQRFEYAFKLIFDRRSQRAVNLHIGDAGRQTPRNKLRFRSRNRAARKSYFKSRPILAF